MNEFESHAIIQLLKLVAANNIIFFFFPHIIHFKQSLNVRVFQIYKHHHAETVDKKIRFDNFKFDKLAFLKAFKDFRTTTFKFDTIKHVFWNIVIYFFNSQIALNVLQIMENEKNPVFFFSFPWIRISFFDFVFFINFSKHRDLFIYETNWLFWKCG